MPEAKIKCEYTYRTGRPCNCEADFVAAPIDGGLQWNLCAIHVGYFLLKRNSVIHTVKRIVPSEERA